MYNLRLTFDVIKFVAIETQFCGKSRRIVVMMGTAVSSETSIRHEQNTRRHVSPNKGLHPLLYYVVIHTV